MEKHPPPKKVGSTIGSSMTMRILNRKCPKVLISKSNPSCRLCPGNPTFFIKKKFRLLFLRKNTRPLVEKKEDLINVY